MTKTPDALWLGVNPSLKIFDQRLYKLLNYQAEMHYWAYHQTMDEPCCFRAALSLLDNYMQRHEPMHLVGHGLSGTLGLLYARLYPARVKSLTLLSVGANPVVVWQAHYYALRNRLPCSRRMILTQMATLLLGCPSAARSAGLANRLEAVLDGELAPHSLAEHSQLSPGGVDVPLLVCHGAHDAIVDPNAHGLWQQYLEPGDRLWSCPKGRHFFHYTHHLKVSPVILDFWQQATSTPRLPLVEILSSSS